MKTEIRKCIVVLLFKWIFYVCPAGLFKANLAKFLKENILKL